MFDNIHVLRDLVGAIIGFFNLIIPLLVSIALLAFIFTVFRYVLTETGLTKDGSKKAIYTSLIALFVLVSMWGIVRLIINTFLPDTLTPGSSQQLTPPPQGSTGTQFI